MPAKERAALTRAGEETCSPDAFFSAENLRGGDNDRLDHRKRDRVMRILDRILHFASVVTDWLLIGAGGLLIVNSLVSIDVAAARYPIMAAGLLIAGAGFWYRRRRKRPGR